MKASNQSTRHPDYSESRRQRILAHLSTMADDTRWPGLTEGARIMYTLGLTICDREGLFSYHDAKAAYSDPSAVQYARTLLIRSGAA